MRISDPLRLNEDNYNDDGKTNCKHPPKNADRLEKGPLFGLQEPQEMALPGIYAIWIDQSIHYPSELLLMIFQICGFTLELLAKAAVYKGLLSR